MMSRTTFWASFVLARVAHGYLPGTGSFVAGNLSAAAPYGIPPAEFERVTERVFSTATFNMTGYGMSVCTHSYIYSSESKDAGGQSFALRSYQLNFHELVF